MRVIVNVLAAVELAVRVWMSVSGMPTRQELRVHVVRPLGEQRSRPWGYRAKSKKNAQKRPDFEGKHVCVKGEKA